MLHSTRRERFITWLIGVGLGSRLAWTGDWFDWFVLVVLVFGSVLLLLPNRPALTPEELGREAVRTASAEPSWPGPSSTDQSA
jgi:hypothetical protein